MLSPVSGRQFARRRRIVLTKVSPHDARLNEACSAASRSLSARLLRGYCLRVDNVMSHRDRFEYATLIQAAWECCIVSPTGSAIAEPERTDHWENPWL